MKNALFRYDSKGGVYKNMGDYVQSIAARQFVGDKAVLLERDHLHEYEGEPVKLIMAAWWMHYPENWPPSKNIVPLFTSFHITPDKADKMLSEEGVAYLKKHEPIGCRDKGTQRLLENRGIRAFFSGCLTLTLGRTYRHEIKKDVVSFVDPHFGTLSFKKPFSLVRSGLVLLKNFGAIKKISQKMYSSQSIKSLLKTAEFYRQYNKLFDQALLVNADYYTHSAYEPGFKSEKEKFDYTDQLLKAYGASRFVVTSRLHVSLPTVAMGVPTLFVQSDKIPRSPGRFEGLLEHVNCIEYRSGSWKGLDGFELPKAKITCSYTFTNKNSHQDLADAMAKECLKFVAEEASNQ